MKMRNESVYVSEQFNCLLFPRTSAWVLKFDPSLTPAQSTSTEAGFSSSIAELLRQPSMGPLKVLLLLQVSLLRWVGVVRVTAGVTMVAGGLSTEGVGEIFPSVFP